MENIKEAILGLANANSLSNNLQAARKTLGEKGGKSYHNAVLVMLAKRHLDVQVGKNRERLKLYDYSQSG